MPGVLILEAMAQTGGLAFQSSFEKEGEGIPVLARVEEFRLKRKVIPGDQLVIEAEVLHLFSNLAKVKVLARVGEEPVAEATLVLAKGSLTPLSPPTYRQAGSGERGRSVRLATKVRGEDEVE